MVKSLTFHKPTSEDLTYIADNMWHEDITELLAAGDTDILGTLEESVFKSKTAVVAKYNGIPLVIYGLRKDSVLGGTGVVWMLTTTQSKKHRREFMVYTRQVIEEMLTECEYLYNYVHAKNKTSIKWLKVLGFNIDKPYENKQTNEWFHLFWIRRS